MEEYVLEIYKPGQDWKGEEAPFQSYPIAEGVPVEVWGLASNTHYTVVLKKGEEIIATEDKSLSTNQGNDESYDENGYYIIYTGIEFKSYYDKEEIKESELKYKVYQVDEKEGSTYVDTFDFDKLNNVIKDIKYSYYVVLIDEKDTELAISEVVNFEYEE